MSDPNNISSVDAELLLKRVYDNKKDICNLLQAEYTQIDASLLYENHVATCKAIVEEQEEKISESSLDNDEALNLDAWESLFDRLDKIDRQLSEPKASAKSVAKSATKLARYGSTGGLNRTELMGSNNTTLHLVGEMRGHNQTLVAANESMMPSSANQSIMQSAGNHNQSTMPPPSLPPKLTAAELSHVSDSVLAEFNAMKISSLEDFQRNRIGPEIRKVLANFTGVVHKLEVFFGKLQGSFKDSAPAARDEDSLADLNDEFVDILSKMAVTIEHVNAMKKNTGLYDGFDDLAELEIPLSARLTEILQKYTHG